MLDAADAQQIYILLEKLLDFALQRIKNIKSSMNTANYHANAALHLQPISVTIVEYKLKCTQARFKAVEAGYLHMIYFRSCTMEATMIYFRSCTIEATVICFRSWGYEPSLGVQWETIYQDYFLWSIYLGFETELSTEEGIAAVAQRAKKDTDITMAYRWVHRC